MRDYVLLGSRLLIICLIAAALLSGTNAITWQKIAEQEESASIAFVGEILGNAQNIQKVQNPAWKEAQAKLAYKTGSLYSADVGGQKAYVLQILTKGYSGDVTFFVGVDASGKILGLRVGANTETAGLGSKIALPQFYGQFAGLNPPVDINGIDKVSGATYSSKAAVAAANGAAEIISKTIPLLGTEVQ